MAKKSKVNNIREDVADYLRIRKALGFKLYNVERLLPQFLDFMEHKKARFITTALALEWAIKNPNCQPYRWALRLSVVRCFARFRLASDPRTEIPPKYLLSHRYRRKIRDIHSDEDVSNLLKAAKQTRSPRGLWADTNFTVLGLLAATGMRVSEVLALDRQDVDLSKGIIIIRNAKFGKSRAIPIHQSTVKTLRAYKRLRDSIILPPKSNSFFVSERGVRMTAKFVGKKYLVLARQAGIRSPKGSVGPRLHDLRHRFAIRTMLSWYQTGVDVERNLPVLSTYLGHTNTANTYWYLSSVPELLCLMTERLDNKDLGEISQ